MKVPFVDLVAQYRNIRRDIDAAIAHVIRDTAFVGGAYVEAFEKDFASYCGTTYAIGVSNGTDALRLSLLACGVKPGDEVITVPHTFIATTEAISMVGATIRFVDVDPETMTMDVRQLKKALRRRTRAIIPVHLYGCPAEMDAIMGFARQHGLRVIGDAAQAHGASYRGKKIGTLGDVVTFSFYPAKNLGAYGDAGAIVTNNAAMANRIAMLRDHGRTSKYTHACEAFSCRLDGMQAAILSAKLPHLDGWIKMRRAHASLYSRSLAGHSKIRLPVEQDHLYSVYHLYVIRVSGRDRLQKTLKDFGIHTGVHYPIPLHRQPAYRHLHVSRGSFPATEEAASRILSLPMYPELSEEQIRYVSASVLAAIGSTVNGHRPARGHRSLVAS